MPGTLRRTRTVTRTDDLGTAVAAVAATHVTHELVADANGAPFRFEERIRGTALLSLETTNSTGVFSGEVEPDNAMVIVWLKSGRGNVDGHRVPIGRPVLYRDAVQPFRWESFHKDVLRIDRAIVEAVAAERGGWEPGPLAFRPHHVPEGPTLASWWLMVRSIAAEVWQGPDEVPEERERELTRYAAGGLLSSVPHWPVGQGGPQTAAHARFARAETFLLEHATEGISVGDVADAAGLSVRGLQGAFQRHHGIPPLAYLRGIRLLLAREMLEERADLPVAEVAHQAGFTHLGRFAAAYRREFGELPRQTRQAALEA